MLRVYSSEVVTFELDCTYLFEELLDPVHAFLDLATSWFSVLHLLVDVRHFCHFLVG